MRLVGLGLHRGAAGGAGQEGGWEKGALGRGHSLQKAMESGEVGVFGPRQGRDPSVGYWSQPPAGAALGADFHRPDAREADGAPWRKQRSAWVSGLQVGGGGQAQRQGCGGEESVGALPNPPHPSGSLSSLPCALLPTGSTCGSFQAGGPRATGAGAA